jgi:hypothetical protein
MTTYEFSDDERRLVIYACGCAEKQLYDYIEYYKKNCDTDSIKECHNEIKKYEAMKKKMKEGGPITVQ